MFGRTWGEDDAAGQGSFTHSVPLPDAENVEGMYYPDIDALYLGTGRISRASVTLRGPITIDEEFAETALDVSLDDVIPTDLAEHFRVEESSTLTHEYGHSILSTASALVSVPLYSGRKGTEILHRLLTTNASTLDGIPEMIARQFETDLYVQLTRPVQEAAAWVVGSYFSDGSMRENLEDRLADIDAELSDVGYRYAPPDYTHPIGSSERTTARRTHFRLSYERAVVAAAHRACRVVPDYVVCAAFLSAASNALMSGFTLVDESSADTDWGTKEDEPAAEFLRAIGVILENIQRIESCAHNQNAITSLAGGLYHSANASTFDSSDLPDYLIRATGLDDSTFVETFRREHHPEDRLPTLLFIEEPATDTVSVLVYGNEELIDQMVLSLLRRFLVRSLRIGTNLFTNDLVRQLLSMLETRLDVPDSVPSGSLVDAVAELYQRAQTSEDVRKKRQSLRAFVTGKRFETTFTDGALRRDLEALCSYSPNDDATAVDNRFDVQSAAANVPPGQFWSEILTMPPRDASTDPERFALGMVDRNMVQYARNTDDSARFFVRAYGIAIGSLYRLDRGADAHPRLEGWLDRFTRRLVEIVPDIETLEARTGFTTAFAAAGIEILTSGLPDPGVETVEQELTDLLRRAASAADELGIRWHQSLVPKLYEKAIAADVSPDCRRAWLATLTAAVVNCAAESGTEH